MLGKTARHLSMKPCALPGAGNHVKLAAHLKHGAIHRMSSSAVAPRSCRRRILVVVPHASYSASSYGPVGGDARIKVVGVGGGGGNAVNRMISSGLQVCCVLVAQIVLLMLTGSARQFPSLMGLIFPLLGRGILGRQYRCASSGKSSSFKQAADRPEPHPRPW